VDAARALRRRTVVRRIVVVVILILAALSILDHLLHPANDWARFDGRSFKVVGVEDDETLLIDDGSKDPEPVRLAGIVAVESPQTDDPPGTTDWAAAAKQKLAEISIGKTVTLRLDPTITRDSDGCLLAWVYMGSGPKTHIETLGETLAAAGLAFADKASDSLYEVRIEYQETEARRQSLGLWSQSALGGRKRMSRNVATQPGAS
jgi:endonuclease YncB( thermonuclease family)